MNLKDPDYQGDVVIMVKQKSKKKRGKKKRGRGRGKGKFQNPIEKKTVLDSNVDIIEKKESSNHLGAKGLNPANEKNNKHRRWDQYYESLFFISHVTIF